MLLSDMCLFMCDEIQVCTLKFLDVYPYPTALHWGKVVYDVSRASIFISHSLRKTVLAQKAEEL